MKKKPRPVPAWDDYFMVLAFFVASRSKDPSTQVGAVIADIKNRIQSTGYNGPPSLIIDKDIDWNRPQKYPFIIHAEQNAIDHCHGHPDILHDSTMYVTCPPCSECTKRMISKRIKKIVYGPQNSTLVNDEDFQTSKMLCKMTHTTLERYVGNMNWMRDRVVWMEENMEEVFQPQLPIPM